MFLTDEGGLSEDGGSDQPPSGEHGTHHCLLNLSHISSPGQKRKVHLLPFFSLSLTLNVLTKSLAPLLLCFFVFFSNSISSNFFISISSLFVLSPHYLHLCCALFPLLFSCFLSSFLFFFSLLFSTDVSSCSSLSLFPELYHDNCHYYQFTPNHSLNNSLFPFLTLTPRNAVATSVVFWVSMVP